MEDVTNSVLMRPADIERKSFEIIREELGDTPLLPGTEQIVLRCIHTSADFDYAHTLFFSDGVVGRVLRAIREGAAIVTDTHMAKAGINKKILESFGGRLYCFMSDEDVAAAARQRQTTRAVISMEKAAALKEPLIFAVGNAPTALLRLCELHEEGLVDPAAVIGVPVGFVNVIDSKERLIGSGMPCIAARGRKGGSNIAACIINAFLYMLSDDRGY